MSWGAQGLRIWLLQRLSAAYMVFYLLAAMLLIYLNSPLDYTIWVGLFRPPVHNIFTILFIFLLLAHAWVGVRDIMLDYIQHLPTRFVLMVAVSVLQVSLAIWAFMALFSVVQL